MFRATPTIEYDLLVAKQVNQGVKHLLLLLDPIVVGLQGCHYLIARLLGMQAVALMLVGCELDG